MTVIASPRTIPGSFNDDSHLNFEHARSYGTQTWEYQYLCPESIVLPLPFKQHKQHVTSRCSLVLDDQVTINLCSSSSYELAVIDWSTPVVRIAN